MSETTPTPEGLPPSEAIAGRSYWFIEGLAYNNQVNGIWRDMDGDHTTRDPLRAMRFDTRAEAQAYIEKQHVARECWTPTEHSFMPPPRPESLDAAVARLRDGGPPDPTGCVIMMPGTWADDVLTVLDGLAAAQVRLVIERAIAEAATKARDAARAESDQERHEHSQFVAEVEQKIAALAEARRAPVQAICEITGRVAERGACPVHHGDNCLVNPTPPCPDCARMREALAKAEDTMVWMLGGWDRVLSESERNAALPRFHKIHAEIRAALAAVPPPKLLDTICGHRSMRDGEEVMCALPKGHQDSPPQGDMTP